MCIWGHKETTLLDLHKVLKQKKHVDLTHAFEAEIPHWPGFPDEKRETLYYYEKGVGSLGSGFWAQRYTIVGQWGTHVDPPAHFVPLVVMDVHKAVETNPDYTLKMSDIKAWEKRHGPVPQGAFVAMRIDWSKRWPDQSKMHNKDRKGCPIIPDGAWRR